LPRLPSSISALAALALIVAASAAADVQAQMASSEFELRPTLGQATQRGARVAQQPAYASPPGSGAGNSGFISTNVPAKGARAAATKTAKQQPAAGTSPSGNLAARVRQTIEQDDVTGSVRPRAVPRAPEEEPYAPVGVRAGSFTLRPSIEVFGGYDDNPFRTNTGKLPSTFMKTEAKIEAESNWSRHSLSGELRGAYTDYFEVPGNDRPEAEAKLRGRIDVTSVSRIELEGRAALTTDAAGSPDAITSAKRPPNIYTLEGSAGYVHRFNRLELGLRGMVERSTHQDAELLSGATLDLSDRDYSSYGGALRGSYESTPDMKPFAEVAIDRRIYDHETDFTGVRRGSDGMRLRGGIEFARERRLSGEISAGYAWRRYDDPTLEDISGLIVDASLIWRATGLTTVTFKANSEIGETTLAGASGVFHRQASVTVDHAFRRWLVGTVGASYGIDDYVGASRQDDRLGLLAGLTYYFNRYAALKGEFRHERLNSTVPGDDYTANIVMLGLRLQR
jgi:hypothetical protein